MTVLVTDTDTPAQQSEAEAILGIICNAYPGHPWAVTVKGGVLFIRHLGLGSQWGMNAKFNDLSHDAAKLKKEVIFMAGEWLERSGLARGRANGDEIVSVEGVPLKYQNSASKPPVAFDTVSYASEQRTTPRPQVNNA